MKSEEIRNSFIDYFKKQHGHRFVPSSPVVPLTDPTLLFTNAGMNQFKPYFLDEVQPEFKRAVNSQKCIRVSGKHNDLEEVGKDTYHHTFFEMLGNWSFGDYYKAEAIEWAWKLFTDVWGLDPNRLYASVYKDDDESLELWKKISGLPTDRILKFGEKDNFWEMGDIGPCGPCSEIHYYRGDDPKHQDAGRVNADDADYIELWNLVFIQYNRDAQGKLHPLPKKHVDTGAGFERIVATLNNVSSNYETDVFLPLLNKISDLSGIPYNSNETGTAHRVIADHIRMLSFAIADGAIPGNEGRSYVLRRILRRAVRFGRQLDMHDSFLHNIVPILANQVQGIFPEIKNQQDHIQKIIKSEEESFSQTLDRGLELFESISLQTSKKKAVTIPGADVFKLYDTFGFPMDLTRLLAEEKSQTIDEKGFETLMEEQRVRARAAGKFKVKSQEEIDWKEIHSGVGSQFEGYHQLELQAKLIKYANIAEQTYLVFDKTPFYAESGGQAGDTGHIIMDSETFTITDTVKIAEDIVHILDGHHEFDTEKLSDFRLKIKTEKRSNTAKNHTATHLLHAALRKVLGQHIHQSGSFVGPDYLRFDFNHFEKISDEDLQNIQVMVNSKIIENLPVVIKEKTHKEAVEEGAMALFGEKYSDKVRTVKIDDFSYELCGGTHVNTTSEINLLFIISESSIASGVRRIEAITGQAAIDKASRSFSLIRHLSSTLKVSEETLFEKVDSLQKHLQESEKEINRIKKELLIFSVEDMYHNYRDIKGHKVITQRIDTDSMDILKELGDKVRQNFKDGMAVFAMVKNDQPQILVVVADELVKQGIHAGKIVGKIGKKLGGGGGGRPHMATAGGKDLSQLDDVLKNIEFIFEN